jgi:ribosomal protein L30E
MVKKNTSADPLSEVRKAIGTKKFVIGMQKTIKELMRGNVAKVFVTENCKDDMKENVQLHASADKVPVEELPIPNDELGTICKKVFAISVVCLLKE